MADLAAHIDLQIRLRQRIANVLHERLIWASLLQNSLQLHQGHGDSPFKSAAYDAITSIESPCNIIFDYPLPVPPQADLRVSRPAPRQKYTNARHSPPSFLYIKSSSLGHLNDLDERYLLKCPQCLRTSFTTLQGLLNHARIAHHLEWGTHEECARACAVVEPDLDFSAGVEVGLGPAGILPGLRSIFQMAVGPKPNQTPDEMSGINSQHPDHITKILGLHEDTPALAPFLGKDSIRRGIKVYGQDDIIDVDGLQFSDTTHQHHPPLHPRNAQHIQEWEQELQVNSVSDHAIIKENVPVVSHPSTSTTFLDSMRSRFHFNSRIVVTDRSFWIPPHCREGPHKDHTHKWMISVHSPSYAHDLTTILKSITVAPAHGIDSTVSMLPFAEAPPYVVVGTAKHPFLARIELFFNGINHQTESLISSAQRIELEHWVELDPLKTATPVIGEEQTMDVELDKRTILGPVRSCSIPLGSRLLWNIKATKTEPSPAMNEGIEEDAASEYTQILNHLLPSFPMTKESRIGRSTDVPYRLIQTHAQLQSLNLGRRKAIEWRRAGALRNAYAKAISGYNHDRFPALSTGDIYSWLIDNGHFLCQPRSAAPKSHLTSDSQEVQHCPACGLAADAHAETGNQSNQSRQHMRCFVKTREFPLIDLKDVIATQMLPPIHRTFLLEAHSLLQVSDPSTMQAVQAMVENMGMSRFYPGSEFSSGTRIMSEATMAPYALLGLTIQLFVRSLVQRGLEMLRHDMELAPSMNGKAKGQDDDRIGVLTPAHVFDGIMAQRDAIFKCLVHVGI